MRPQARGIVVAFALGVPLVESTASVQMWDLASLRAFAGLTADQWKSVNRSEPQARILDTQEKREVAVIGVARVRATTSCFLSKFLDIESFKKNPAVLRIRKFVRPIDSRDLEGFSLEP